MFLIVLSGRALSICCALSICPLTPIPCDVISLHLVEEFQWNLAECNHVSGHYWKGIKVRDQGHSKTEYFVADAYMSHLFIV